MWIDSKPWMLRLRLGRMIKEGLLFGKGPVTGAEKAVEKAAAAAAAL
jgi:hypothetical protein